MPQVCMVLQPANPRGTLRPKMSAAFKAVLLPGSIHLQLLAGPKLVSKDETVGKFLVPLLVEIGLRYLKI